MKKPNIVFICTDQQRADSLNCAGNPFIHTPHIDSIAKNGTRFARHITPMQICSPSRATMITGLYPRSHQLIMNGMALPESIPTLTQQLVNSGYSTHSVGKQHLQPLLAPVEKAMPDSRAFWKTQAAKNWNGPYYGYQTIDLLLGESDTAHIAGHYAQWLKKHYPQRLDLFKPEASSIQPPADLDEIWTSAMPVESHYNTWISKSASAYIEKHKDAKNPFFLFVSYPDPHHPFDPPETYVNEYVKRFCIDDLPLPRIDSGELDKMPSYIGTLYPKGQGFRELYWAAFDDMEAGSMITTEDISARSLKTAVAHTNAMIEMIDDGVGSILQTIDKTIGFENTLIIFTSDHGEYLGQHGLMHKGPTSYRQLTEVSFLMQGPGIHKGQTIHALTNHVDLTPTILDITDCQPMRSDGYSLSAILKGEKECVREFNFGEYHPTVKPELYNQSISTKDWRLTLYPKMPGWGELFDLNNDPEEHNNLFHERAAAQIVQDLSKQLAATFPPQDSVENEWLCKW